MKEKILFFGVFYIILGTLGLTIPSISYYLIQVSQVQLAAFNL